MPRTVIHRVQRRTLVGLATVCMLVLSCSAEQPASEAAARIQVDAARMTWQRYALNGGGYFPVPPGSTPGDAVRAMIDHHLEAIDASQRFLDDTPTTSAVTVRQFAANLIDAQSGQVDEMRAWLVEHGESTEPAGWDPVFCGSSTTGSAGGFLATMIVHHQAAVDMYQTYVRDGLIFDDQRGVRARSDRK